MRTYKANVKLLGRLKSIDKFRRLHFSFIEDNEKTEDKLIRIRDELEEYDYNPLINSGFVVKTVDCTTDISDMIDKEYVIHVKILTYLFKTNKGWNMKIISMTEL